MEAYTTGNPFFWIVLGVLTLWLVPCLVWGNAMWWAWTRKVENGATDQLWFGWLEISKAVVFGRFVSSDKMAKISPILEMISKLPGELSETTAHKPD